ncbi:MAG: gliding motility-associated peptidyl-prolyl isomerase GldI [Nonlabens sp.]
MKVNYARLLSRLLIAFVVFVTGCSQTVPRKPIKNTSGSSLDLSIELNRKLYQQEEARIEAIIYKNNQQFERSGNGFYYRFIARDSMNNKTPVPGDRVTFEYNVVTLGNDTLYRTRDVSPVTNSLEREYGTFKGMREALQLMNKGDVMEAYFPSYTAYGSYGDRDAIPPNSPFKSRIKLLEIN